MCLTVSALSNSNEKESGSMVNGDEEAKTAMGWMLVVWACRHVGMSAGYLMMWGHVM